MTDRIGMIGPDQTQPCGIADYSFRLATEMGKRCDLAFVPFRHALTDSRLNECRAILVQYERSLVPGPGFLDRLASRYPGKIYLVPHEVYDEDPFAFPFANLRSAFPPFLWMKQMRYRWSHRNYAEEKRLQARGYGVHRVIPLSRPTAEILGALAGDKILDPVPHAFFSPMRSSENTPVSWEFFFPAKPRAILGIFGFLNPGLDYGSVLDLLVQLDPEVTLMLLGGSRDNEAVSQSVKFEVDARGLGSRVKVSGYLAEAELDSHLRLCDVFICPLRYKSNSGSILHLIHLGKPILTKDIPLTRYLKEMGAPLDLYSGGDALLRQTQAAVSGAYTPPPNHYSWDFEKVADEYVRILSLPG